MTVEDITQHGGLTRYPNREHKNEDASAALRAVANLDAIIEQARDLKLKLESGGRRKVFADDAQGITNAARELTRDLTMLETFRNVRDWHAADEAEKATA